MDVSKIIIVMTTTLFSLTNCDDQLLSVELTLPDIMTTFTSIEQAMRSLQGTDASLMGGDTLAENVMTKVKWMAYSYLFKALRFALRRGNLIRPAVEIGPGAFKSEIVKYPPNYFVGRLKTLIKIKKREEELDKQMKAPK